MASGLAPARLQRLKQWQEELVREQRLPNTQLIVWRNGVYCYDESTGIQREDKPLGRDGIFRIFSMTKPVVSVALMMLYEEGKFMLTDPAHLYLGDKWSKENMRVYASGDFATGYTTVPCEHEITVKHLLTHTAGLSYGFDAKGVENKVDEIYVKTGVSDTDSLCDFVDRLAGAPLYSQPGRFFKYGYNTDVCGRLVEVLSGVPLAQFLEERIFKPLGMVDTAFHVPQEKQHRLCSLWMPHGADLNLGVAPKPQRGPRKLVNIEKKYRGVRFASGGGGLLSTAMDYARFCEMLMLGGQAGGVRLLSRKTVDWMTTNHLEKDGRSVEFRAIMAPGYTEMNTDNVGFGLGFEVIGSPAGTRQINSRGSFRWGGAASTTFFCDPEENMFAVFMTQLMFNSIHEVPLTPLLKQLTYGCIDDCGPRSRL